MPVKFRKTGSFKFSLSKHAQSTFIDIGMNSEGQPSKRSRRFGLKKLNKARNVGFGHLAEKRKLFKSNARATMDASDLNDLNLDQLTMEAQLSSSEQRKQAFAIISGVAQPKNADSEDAEKQLAAVTGSGSSTKSRKNFSIRQILNARSPIIASLLPPRQVTYDDVRKPTSGCQDSSSTAKPVTHPPPPSFYTNTHSPSTKPSYSLTTSLNPAKPVYSTPPLNQLIKPISSRPTRGTFNYIHPNLWRQLHSDIHITKSYFKPSKLTPLNSNTLDLILQQNSGNTLQKALGIKV
ncbi:hypothetical protein BKA69DRAFT_475656 [Paraphysoderma sedebokerense]|nr:hypothetical protein BKA69DRAFT_475400 [Paraphysoderma sedebokerense]KAI9140882.1 hypothetical protein BKA69DRAFT_475656 [Paraphysoderma sedebokerense]